MALRRVSRYLLLICLAGRCAGGIIAHAGVQPITAPAGQTSSQLSAREAQAIAADAYLYAYPLVTMETARRMQTNAVAPDMALGAGAPVNRYTHMARMPDALLHGIGSTPDADVLWSSLWFDVSREPLVIDVPDAQGRYFMMMLADMWSDVFAAPGTRNAPPGRQTYAIAARDWRGTLPRGVELLRAPTSSGWLHVRIAVAGSTDLAAAQVFQSNFDATPLSRWNKKGAGPAPAGQFDPALPGRPPAEQVAEMSPGDYLAAFAELAGRYPPHDNDTPILQRLRRLGLEPGRRFEFERLPAPLQAAIKEGLLQGQTRLRSPPEPRAGSAGLVMPLKRRGAYGTDYALRARSMRLVGVAPLSDDMIQVRADSDSEGRLLDGTFRYEIRFERRQQPPVDAFWTLTLYNDRDALLDNMGNRYAVRMRDQITASSDDSSTIYLQYEAPVAERTRNWLPAPQSGHFSLILRLYSPGAAVVEGTWTPPSIRRVQ